MADEPDPIDDEPLELTDVVDDASDDADDGPETTIGFDDEPTEEPQPDNAVIRKMRQELRERDKRIAELSRAKEEPEIEIGEKPTLAGCDYDEELFETKLDSYKERVAQANTVKAKRQTADREVQDAWQADIGKYETEKAKLGVADYGDAEDTIKATLDNVQQAVIVKAADRPARFLYALAQSDARLAELAKIKDPIKMAAAVARMEGAIKEMPRKSPEPDRPQRGSAQMPGGADKTLEKLEKDAERTGDRTKLIAHRREMAKKE